MRTPQPPTASPARPADDTPLARRLDRHGEELALLRIQFLNMQAALSRWPALRRFLRSLPRNLKALNSSMVPFSPECWSGRRGPRSHVAATIAYLRAHPGVSANAAARACGATPLSLRRSPLYRDLRLEQTQAPRLNQYGVPTTTERAVRYLAAHRPRTIAEVVRAIGSSPTSLYNSRPFRAAWVAYRHGAGPRRTHPWQKRRRGT